MNDVLLTLGQGFLLTGGMLAMLGFPFALFQQHVLRDAEVPGTGKLVWNICTAMLLGAPCLIFFGLFGDAYGELSEFVAYGFLYVGSALAWAGWIGSIHFWRRAMS